MSRDAEKDTRMRACREHMPRVLNMNLVPGYLDRSVPPVATTIPRPGLSTETGQCFAYRSTPVNKDAHLKKDYMKQYVEKALQLRDARGGMAVVSSPIWAPAGTARS